MNKDNFTQSGSQDSWKIVAFEDAVNLHGSVVEGYFRRETGNATLAEDLTQELWLAVHKTFKPHQYAHHGLLMHKARQILIDELRRQKTRSIIVPLENEKEPLSAPWKAASEEDAKRAKDHMWENFSQMDLTEIQKQAGWLVYHDGFTIQEAADKLQTSKSTLHDWLIKLKAECYKYYYKE